MSYPKVRKAVERALGRRLDAGEKDTVQEFLMDAMDDDKAKAATPTTTVITGAATEEELWAAFTGGKDAKVSDAPPTAPSAKGAAAAGAVVQTVTVPPGE